LLIFAVSKHRHVALVVAAFGTLATIYSLVTPVFEASDEISHYPVVEYVARTGNLPVQIVGTKSLWEQEGSQPPLYYAIAAALTSWIDTRDLQVIRTRNPHAKLGIPLDPDNKNMILHTDAEDFPWRGTTLAVHLIRFLSIGFSTITVALSYFLSLHIWPHRRPLALLSTVLVAFNPMYLFISGSVNNDTLVIALCTGSLLIYIRIIASGLTKGNIFLLAILASLASITKISGLTVLPLAGATLLIHGAHKHQWRACLTAAVILAIVWIVIAGWWYIRNVMLYQEVLGIETQVAIAGGRQITLFNLIRDEWYGFWVSYWAEFGAVNILADPIVYGFYGLITLVAWAGLIVGIVNVVRKRLQPEILLPGILAFDIGLVFVGFIKWTLMTYASQGRLMFPVIAALSVFTAKGVLNFVPIRFQKFSILLLAAALLSVALMSPVRYIAPAYAKAPNVPVLPANAIPVGVVFEGLELVGVEAYDSTVHPGEYLPVTLYWRAVRPITQNFSIYLHVLGRNYEPIGKIDSYPGGGTWPTKSLTVGTIIADYYEVRLNDDFEAPTIIRVQVGAGKWEQDNYTVLNGTTTHGEPAGTVLVDAGVAYPPDADVICSDGNPAIADDIFRAQFGDFALLYTAEISMKAMPGDKVPVPLIWKQVGEPNGDWTVFVQLLNTAGEIVAQADSPPLNNDYPTRLWRVHCVVTDTHVLTLPTTLGHGTYTIFVGLYDAHQPMLPRLEPTNLELRPFTNDAVEIGSITVQGK